MIVRASTSAGMAVLACCCLAKGADLPRPRNPYERIAVRNIFGLRPQIPIQKPTPPSPPLPTIILTGITTILGDKRAFLEITPVAKSVPAAKPRSCVLAEGQREEDIEVLKIEPKAGSVEVSNGGTLMMLTFEKNGRKPEPVVAPRRPMIPTHPFALRTAAR